MSQTPPPPQAPAPQPMAPDEERMWAMLAHLSGIVLLVIGPLIIMLVFGPRSAFTRRQAVEALNWQILVLIGVVISSVLTMVIIGAILLPIVIIVGIVFMVIGGIKANNGEEYRYPFNWRIVK